MTTKKAAVKEKSAPKAAKVEKKAAPKAKAAPKKKVSTVVACTCTFTCKPEECFWVNNGPVVASLAGLLEAVRSMSDEQFAYHTLREGNDFARWIRFSLADDASAKRVEKARTRDSAVKALEAACSCK